MPFITPPSQYQILGSNITGGSPNLIVNNGINNFALGNFVLTNNSDGNNNVAIGNLALNENINYSNQVAIGVGAGQVNGSFDDSSADDNVFIGYLAGGGGLHNDSVIIGSQAGYVLTSSDNYSRENVIIGGFTVGNSEPLNTPTIELDNNVFIGFSNLTNLTLPINATVMSNNIVIGGGNLNNGVDTLDTFNNNVFITNNSSITNTVENTIVIGGNVDTDYASNQIYIGDPDLTYTAIWLGNVNILAGGGGGGVTEFIQLTDVPNSYAGQAGMTLAVNVTEDALEFVPAGGGGGFSAIATQTADEEVSITSTANDGVSDVGAGYTFLAQSDNTTFANSSLTSLSYNGANGANSNYSAETSLFRALGNVSSSAVFDGLRSNLNLDFQSDGTTASSVITASVTNPTIDNSVIQTVNTESAQIVASLVEGTRTDTITIDSSVVNNDGTTIILQSLESDQNSRAGLSSFMNLLGGSVSTDLSLDSEFSTGAANVYLYSNVDAAGVNTNAALELFSDGGNNSAILNTFFDGVTNDSSLTMTAADTARIALIAPVFDLTAPAEVGTERFRFTANNAPVAGLEVTNYIAVTLNGVAGYIPFLSVP